MNRPAVIASLVTSAASIGCFPSFDRLSGGGGTGNELEGGPVVDSAIRDEPAPDLAAPDLAAPDLAAPDQTAPDVGPPTTCAGYALLFTGSSYVKVDRPVQDDFTIEAWIKTSDTGPTGNHFWNGNGLFWADVLGDADDFGVTLLGSKIAFGAGKAGGGETNVFGTTSVNSGAWTHVAVTRQKTGGQMQLFINGAVDGTATDTGQARALNASASMLIGGNAVEKRFFIGAIDEVRAWNVVRTSDQINASKNGRLDGNESGLVGYWRFDEGVGLLALDSGYKKNHGVLQGPPEWIVSDAPLCP
jgi:hypothetical protein